MNAFLGRLTLVKKFLLLGIIAVVMFGFPTYLFVSGIDSSIETATEEAQGAEYLVATMRLLQETQQHRGLSAAVLSGNQDMRQAWEKKRGEIDETIKSLDQDTAQHPEYGLATPWEDVKKQWAALKTDVGGLSAPESFKRHTDLIERITDFIVLAADGSGITYDPTVEGYQLGFLSAQQLPMLTENMGRLRAWGNAILVKHEATPEELSRISDYSATMRRQLFEIGETLEKIYAANPELKKTLDAPAKNLKDASSGALQFIDDNVVNAKKLDYPAQDYFTFTTKVIDKQFELVDQVSAQLKASLEDQRKGYEKRKYTLLGSVLGLLALACLFSWAIVLSITAPARQAVKVVNRLAEGDLTVRIEVKGKDEMAQLLAAIKTMVEKLSGIITSVRTSADALSSASQEISATAQSLSQASSEQAASVEETSASIEQMTASVNQNTENARITDSMAAKAAKEATEGGESVASTVEAMKKIAGKIGIVDDIAYQTNLLALNAAIEAARAGEHGKGFAVVAAEVRKLAERSQVAAQEIGELAGSSVGLAEKAGKLLEEMVPSINKTSDLVQEIASASSEQSSGVAQINSAMGQMNQTTQQNASASEELAATAEEMNAQAERLQNEISFFRVDEAVHKATDTQVHEPAATARKPAAVVRHAASPAATDATGRKYIDADPAVFSKAIEAHMQWRTKLHACIHDKAQCADPDVAEKDNLCALGKWIYGEGAEFSSDQQFQQLKGEHATFHRAAAKVIRSVQQNRVAEAKTILNGEYSDISKKVITSLSGLKVRCRHKAAAETQFDRF